MPTAAVKPIRFGFSCVSYLLWSHSSLAGHPPQSNKEMMSLSLSWASKKAPGSASALSNHANSVPRYTPSINNSQNRKRRHTEEEARVQKPASTRRHVPTPVSKHKKSRTPRILGQSLPINRLVEVLDHKSLQTVIDSLLVHHPEIASTISKLSPRPSLANSLELIERKFQCITDHLPYKCDVESDYSYLRIKPHLNEFLNCLLDFILSLLPPVETSLLTSSKFLHTITSLMHTLPNFSNNEFQYTRSMAYEQILNAWLIVLSQKFLLEEDAADLEGQQPQHKLENSVELIKVIDELNLKECLEKHNDVTMGKFSKTLDFIRAEVDNYEHLSHTLHNNGSNLLNDMITVDYSNFSIAARTSH